MERKSSTQNPEIELFSGFLQIDSVLVSGKTMMKITILKVKFCNHQLIANLPWNATEIERFLKMYEIGFFLEEIVGFFRKELDFFRTVRSDNFAVK